MRPLIESNRDVIARVCRLHGVRKLEVFGSILRNDFDP
jgi:predicted nucleotidyltransferase